LYNNKTFDDQVALIGVTITQDEYANEVETEIERTVFADTGSVGRNEFYNAAKEGLRPTIIITVRYFEYENEKYLKYDNKKYKVERTYSEDKENIELTCSEVTV